MPIRIVHTADNHVGIAYQRYAGDPEVRARLIAERIEALKRVVAEANARQAHFLVVAGDLFDRPTVAQRDVKDVVAVLAGFAGTDVLVLPGNHDFYEGPQSSLWKTFRDAGWIYLLCNINYPLIFSEKGEEAANCDSMTRDTRLP